LLAFFSLAGIGAFHVHVPTVPLLETSTINEGFRLVFFVHELFHLVLKTDRRLDLLLKQLLEINVLEKGVLFNFRSPFPETQPVLRVNLEERSKQ
jgi:hypothetical protein